MVFKKVLVGLFCMAIIMMCVVSCSFQSNTIRDSLRINDISADTKYLDIISKGYMGGALIYNETDQSLGQLANGVSVAVRLSKAQRYDTSDTASVFQEQKDSAVYGLLIIDEIDSDKISS